jgi:hypothetical protein
MQLLIGILMAVFQGFATLHIAGRREKEHETRTVPFQRGVLSAGLD